MKYEPEDNQTLRLQYESEGKGTCGPAVIAVITRKTVRSVLDDWGIYPGHATVKEMRRVLRKNHIIVRQKPGKRAKEFKGDKAVLRIQWVGPGDVEQFHGHDSWHEATNNTHWLYVEDGMVFCNDAGWFPKSDLKKYLRSGYITTYYEIVGEGDNGLDV